MESTIISMMEKKEGGWACTVCGFIKYREGNLRKLCLLFCFFFATFFFFLLLTITLIVKINEARENLAKSVIVGK